MKPPYTWMGGKARVASLVWERFGDVPNYVEPFFGGGAVMLARPGWDLNRGAWADGKTRIETCNDINAWLANLWRAVKADPDGVAHHASDPVSELDLHARGDWLFYRANVDRDFVERLRGDPDYYDVKSAGWWVWGQSSWIGDHWGRSAHNARKDADGNACAVTRACPHLGDAGQGVNRKLPPDDLVNTDDPTETPRRAGIRTYLRQLCARMCRVRVCCGDWARVLGPSPTTHQGITAVFLDPPYAVADHDSVYGEDDSYTVAHEVREWCLTHGDNPKLRIALCGYDEHDMPDTWERVAWKAHGGYSNQNANGSANRGRETIWFSPHCLRPSMTMQHSLFGEATA